MLKINYKLIFQNIFGTFFILTVIGALAYFCFYVPLFKPDSNREISGIVKDKWVDISETQQGSGFELKALVETETGERVVIKCGQKSHSKIKIGTLVKRETNGDVKILR